MLHAPDVMNRVIKMLKRVICAQSWLLLGARKLVRKLAPRSFQSWVRSWGWSETCVHSLQTRLRHSPSIRLTGRIRWTSDNADQMDLRHSRIRSRRQRPKRRGGSRRQRPRLRQRPKRRSRRQRPPWPKRRSRRQRPRLRQRPPWPKRRSRRQRPRLTRRRTRHRTFVGPTRNYGTVRLVSRLNRSNSTKVSHVYD